MLEGGRHLFEYRHLFLLLYPFYMFFFLTPSPSVRCGRGAGDEGYCMNPLYAIYSLMAWVGIENGILYMSI